MVDFIINNIKIFVFFIQILWALILDGIFVTRGNGFVKINYFIEKRWQIQKAWKGFLAYIIEMSILTIIISSNYITAFINNLLIDNPYPIIIISVLIGYGRFRKDIYGHWLSQS